MKNEFDVESIWNEMKNVFKFIFIMVFSVIGDLDNFVLKFWLKFVF